jgi:lipopolysaccharide biosynthesis glycosyltransferase
VGFDQREAAAYHTFCQSVIDRTSEPVAFKPLTLRWLREFKNHAGGTNEFITSRYLIPALEDFRGWAVFADGDMVVAGDLAELWALRDDRFALMCVQHCYTTRHARKYVGTPMEADNADYPRKNWSSLMLVNCGHPANQALTLDYVANATPKHLHRFEWLMDHEIGMLPGAWNVLAGEQPVGEDAKLIHHTLGVPGFEHYADADRPGGWHHSFLRALHLAGQSPRQVVERACMRG